MDYKYEAIDTRKLLRLKDWQKEASRVTGTVHDMDTVLADIQDQAETCTNGIGETLIDLYLDCTNKRVFQTLFSELTGETWGKYLARAELALAETLHKEG